MLNIKFANIIMMSFPFIENSRSDFVQFQAASYGVPSVSKTLTNAVFVYLPLIYKCGTDLAKYLPDLYIWG